MKWSARRAGMPVFTVAVLAAMTVGSATPSTVGLAAWPTALPVFDPLLSRLAHAPVPVYLPSWLPAHPRLYPTVSFFTRTEFNYGPRVSGYRIELFDSPRESHATELFYMEGSAYPLASGVPVGPSFLATNDTRPVRLARGRWAYIYPNSEGNDGPSVFWWEQRALYHFGRQLSDRVLIRVARSVVRIP